MTRGAFGASRRTILAVDETGRATRVPIGALGEQLTQHERVLARRYGSKWREAAPLLEELRKRRRADEGRA